MSTIQAEASKPQKKMQECNRCKAAGFSGQMISFEKIGADPATGRIRWKLVDENGVEHSHKTQLGEPNAASYQAARRRRIVDIAAITDISEAKKLLASGWEYKTSYPATIANVPHYILVRRE